MFEQNEPYFDISPKAFNCLEGLKDHPDETLQMLQIGTNYTLASEQRVIALCSMLKLADVKEVNMLDLVEVWQNTPTLSSFAAHLRQVFLPQP